MPDRTVHLPRTSSGRNDLCWARLLSRVSRHGPAALAFEGQLLRSGAYLQECDLWPSADYPKVPVLIEHAGLATPGWGHRRSEHLYILWRYDQARATWWEIARAASIDAGWADALAPAARRALAEQAPAAPECSEAAERLLELLDDHLDRYRGLERSLLLNALYNGVTHRIVEEADLPLPSLACARYNSAGAQKKAPQPARRGDGEAPRRQAV